MNSNRQKQRGVNQLLERGAKFDNSVLNTHRVSPVSTSLIIGGKHDFTAADVRQKAT